MSLFALYAKAKAILLRRAEKRIIADTVGAGYNREKLDYAMAEPDEPTTFIELDADTDLRGAIDSGASMGAL